ncbi:MAG: 50S ribosomal protein L40e [Candidatus Korarchaeota archaeon]
MPQTDPIKLRILTHHLFEKKVCRRCSAVLSANMTRCRRCNSTAVRIKKRERKK